jgi:hypothetical protein
MTTSKRIKLKITTDESAAFFLKWELPHFHREFEIVTNAGPDVILLSFAPRSLISDLDLPAYKRVALLIPGYVNPFYDLDQRHELLKLIEEHYDLALVNPGPVKIALSTSAKLVSHPFSVDVDKLAKVRRVRKSLDSLLHVSADAPHKDWERSERIMRSTGLPFEVFPPRQQPTKDITLRDRIMWRYNKYIVRSISPTAAFRRNFGYVSHAATIAKYGDYDAFVHIARQKPLLDRLDGKYTAALLEAGVTGAIIFWHDTYNDGNDFETIFAISAETEQAAKEILEIRKSIDIEKHSKDTIEEISARCHPARVVRERREAIEAIL